MADSTDVILRISERHWAGATRARDRMDSLADVLVISAAVLQGVIVLRGFDAPSLLAAALIIGLGVYGALSCHRHVRRFRRDMERFTQLAGRLDELAPDAGLVALETGSPEDHGDRIFAARFVHVGLVALGVINVALVIFV
jgi:hypothetical protein